MYIQDKDVVGKQTHYEILGLRQDCQDHEIRNAYKKLLLQNHPDKNGDEIIRINEIQNAYKVLIDPKKKKEYDESLEKTFQKQGFNIYGEGLDEYDLNDFNEAETEEGELIWTRDCPRCQAENSMIISEESLEQNIANSHDKTGSYAIIVQCESCSLWIKVKYYDTE